MKKAGKKKAAQKPAAPRRGGHWISDVELSTLQDTLREAQETLDAIRNGEVDAVVVSGSHGKQVYSLAGAEQPYRVYVEQMQEGAVTVGEDGLILYANQRFAAMVGRPLERVISSRISQYIPAAAWDHIGKVFGGSTEVVKHECQLRFKKRELPVNLTASRLPMDGQSILCLVVTDLTALLESNALRLAKEGAEKASEAKDAFLAALSHELRTPLTPALMATMALENDASLPAACRQTLSMIRRNVELEARLIDDLLDLTRIATGKLELHLKPVDVHSVIRSALEICETDIHGKQQKLTLDMAAAHTQVEGDAVRLQQVMWNVVRNAVKFTGHGGAIFIRTGNHAPDTLTIEVSDTGVGFDMEAAPGLFKAFEQGGREITRRFGGLGLGLAISRSIMDAHQGRIGATSPGPGKGATFTLDLPLNRTDATKSKAPQTGAKAAAGEQRGMRILLVEDHKDTRSSMEHLLRRARHEVHAVESAALALTAAAGQVFDLVVSDLGLPDMSGIDLMRQLRDRHQLRGIAVSGYGMEEDVQRSRDAGFLHHLTKPIRMDQLRRLLQEWTPQG